jgi:Prenyltransferase and squalene oxidase repeat
MNTNLNEIDRQLQAITQQYTEVNYFQRLKRMRQGLACPRASKEYKAAMIEVQRLSAPAAAVFLPLFLVGVMVILSAATDAPERIIEYEYKKEPKAPELEKFEKPKEKVVEKTEDVKIDIEVNKPNVEVEKPLQESPNPGPPNADPPSPNPPKIDVDIGGPTIRHGPPKFGPPGSGGPGKSDGPGPTVVTEEAVIRTLRWLKKNQQPDGSWLNNRIAMTSLAILTFLSHAETPGKSEEFGETVKKGLEYLLSQQTPDGRFKGSDGHEYSLPIATYALCEAYGMTMNPNVKDAAERSLTLIVKGQHPSGGWDYNVKQSDRDDTSYMGWCAQAIKAGYLSHVKVEGLDKALKLAVRGFKKNASPTGGFGYTAPAGNHGMTGVGTLCMQLLGGADASEVTRSMEVMDKWVPSFEEKANGISGTSLQYYFYYATQCRFHAGGKRWKNWDTQMKATYISAQKTLGTNESAYVDHKGVPQEIGWWENKDHHTDRPVMDSCLAALQLMVYYRYLPTTSAAALKQTIEELNPTSTEKDDIVVTAMNL